MGHWPTGVRLVESREFEREHKKIGHVVREGSHKRQWRYLKSFSEVPTARGINNFQSDASVFVQQGLIKFSAIKFNILFVVSDHCRWEDTDRSPGHACISGE